MSTMAELVGKRIGAIEVSEDQCWLRFITDAGPVVYCCEGDDGKSRQEADSFYGVELRTKKGTTNIVYRNSSNGYYGGGCGLASAVPTTVKFKPVLTDDWSAS